MGYPFSSDGSGTYPLEVRFYTDDSKSQARATVTSIKRSYLRASTMEPHQHEFTLELEDKAAQGITQGDYYEFLAGDTSVSHAVRWRGFVENIQLSTDFAGAYDITGASGSVSLNDQISAGGETYAPHIFSSIIDILNGVQNPPGSGQYPPGYRGFLSDTRRKAVWKDSRPPAASTTTSGSSNVTAAVIINVASTSGFTAGHWLQVNATDSFLCTNVINGTQLGIYPALNQTYAAGVAVNDLGYKPLALGVGSDSQWESELLNLTTICDHFGVPWTDDYNATHSSGPIYVGPAGDDSTLVIWGEENLRQDLAANHGITGLDHANAGLAQQFGYAVIGSVNYSEDIGHVKNAIFLNGKGQPDHGGVTLAPLVGGKPFDDAGGSPSAPINGWSIYQPDVRLYFVKAASSTTYDGQTYEFIARQREGQYMFQYGVIDRGGATGNNPPPFGVREMFLHSRMISRTEWLLAAGIGHLMWNAQPVASYQFTVRHPMTSGAAPLLPRPGQKITINYTGDVEALAYDTNPTSPTYGQLISAGTFHMLQYPPAGMLTSDPRYAKLQRAVVVEEEWTEDGQCIQTFTMGRDKWHSKYWADQVAREMEHNVHGHRHPQTASFKKVSFDGIEWGLSQGTQGASTGWAFDDRNANSLTLQPASVAFSDVANDQFFGDHHRVSWTMSLVDVNQYLDFWFAKKVDAQLGTLSSSRIYGLFRFALPNRAETSGFYTTTDGTTLAARGQLYVNGIFDLAGHLGTGTYRCYVDWSGGKFAMHMAKVGAAGKTRPVAVWNDTGGVLSQFGAIGWHLVGGGNTVTLKDLHANPIHYSQPPKGSVGTGAKAATDPHRKRSKQTATQYSGGGGSSLAKAQ